MQKRLYVPLWVLLVFICSQSRAQFDTTIALYDFEALPNGNLNGTDNWQTTLFSTSVDWRVADTLFSNVGKGIFFNQVGPNVGASASRAFDTLFPNAQFDPSQSIYVFQFDVVRNYWGLDIGISADLNNDGKTSKADVLEKALTFRSGSLNGEILTAPNGTAYTLGNNLSNAWHSIRITIRPFTGSFGGTVDVEYQPLFAPTWNSLATGLPLYADSLSTTKTNITRWNTVFIHSEGATGKVDELRFTKISPQVSTGISNVDQEPVHVYVKDNLICIQSVSPTQTLRVFDTTGRCVMERSCGDCAFTDAGQLCMGTYVVQGFTADNRLFSKRVFKP
ncbi:MAG: hypothetical protein ACKOQY_12245 [Bacteroidota bacterium]